MAEEAIDEVVKDIKNPSGEKHNLVGKFGILVLFTTAF